MKKFAADNLMLLRKSYPEIYKLVRNKYYNQDAYRITHARNGQANLMIRDHDGRELSLYSRYNPELEAAKWVESLDDQIRRADHLLICGFGFGYHIAALLQAFPNKKLYIYEPEVEYLLAAIESCDLRSIMRSSQIAMFAVGHDPVIQSDMVAEMYKLVKDSFTYVVIPVYNRLHPVVVNQLSETARKGADTYRRSMATVTRFQTEWTENLILNMRRNLETYSLAPTKGMGAGIPAIIVGSGPSLDMEIDGLRAMQNRAIIIAAGSSIQALLHRGVQPHLAVSMDPSEANYRVFEKINTSNIPFLYIPTIKHTILEHDNPFYMHAFFNADAISRHLMDLSAEDPIFYSTSTVTGTAIQTAVYLGCSEIVFIGQDFSFPNDRVYADGVTHFSDQQLENDVREAELTVKNVSGGLNRTNASMLSLKSGIEEAMRRLSYEAYYNASRIGAHIEMTRPKTLEQLAAQYPQDIYDGSWFKEQLKARLTPYSEERISSIKRAIRVTYESIPRMMVRAEAIETHMEQAAEYSQHRIHKWFEAFDEHWSAMLGMPVFKSVYSFLLQRERNYIERHWADLKAQSDSYVKIERLKEIINPLLKGIHTVTPVLNRSFEALIDSLQKESRNEHAASK